MANLQHTMAYYKEFALDHIQELICQKDSALHLSGIFTGPTRSCNGEGYRVTEFDRLDSSAAANQVGLKSSDYDDAAKIRPAGVSTNKKAYKTHWDAFVTRASISNFTLADHGIPEETIMRISNRLKENVYNWFDNRFFSEAPQGFNFDPSFHGRDEPSAATAKGDIVINNTDPTAVSFTNSGQVRNYVTTPFYVKSGAVVASTPSFSWNRSLPGIAATVEYDTNSKLVDNASATGLNEGKIIKATRMLGKAFVAGELRRGMKVLITNYAHGTNWRDEGKHQLSSDFNALLGTGLHDSIMFDGGELSRVGNLYILALINGKLPQFKAPQNTVLGGKAANATTDTTVQCSFLTYTNNLSLVMTDSPGVLPMMAMDITNVTEDGQFDIRTSGAVGVNYRNMGAVVPIFHSVME